MDGSVQKSWDITENMMWGFFEDFNPYHDATNGQFTFAEGVNAMAPIHGRTENGERLLSMYKERHVGPKAKKQAESKPEAPKVDPAEKTSEKGEQAVKGAESLQDIERQLSEIESDLAVARILDDTNQQKALENKKNALLKRRGQLSGGYKHLTNEDAVSLASQLGQDPVHLGDDVVRTLTSGDGYFGTSHSFTLNESLRNGWDLQEGEKELVKTIDSLMRPSPENLSLVRMVGPSFFNTLGISEENYEDAVGKVYPNAAYSSTSFDYSKNVFKVNKVRLNIKAPAGTKMLISPDWFRGEISEAEICLARNTALKVTGITKGTNKFGRPQYTVEAEVLLDKDS